MAKMVFYDLCSHWCKRGPRSCGAESKGGETLARRGCGGTMHFKGFVMNSRPLTFGSERWHRRMPDKLEKSCHVGKVHNLCRVKSIRIAVSTVMDVLAKATQS